MKLPDKIYDVLKWFCVIVAHALVTYIGVMAEAWCWDIPTQAICTTISATATFLGAIFCISTITYNKTKDKENK